MKKSYLIFVFILFLITLLCILLAIASRVENEVEEKVYYQTEYLDIIEKYSIEYDVEESIILAIIKCESNFDKDATSSVGAMGLMQMMPDTFSDMQRRLSEKYETAMLYEPEISIKYGTYYLKYLYNIFNDWELVYAAYNAGMGNVSRWLENEEYSKDGKLLVIPFAETDKYVKKVISTELEYEKILSSEEQQK